MARSAKNRAFDCYDALAVADVAVFRRSDHYDGSPSGFFGISGEGSTDAGKIGADYWGEVPAPGDEFGVPAVALKILKRFRLFAEWETPGSLNVYDAD